MRMRRVRSGAARLLVVLGLLIVGTFALGVTPASAHAALESTSPASDARLLTSPRRIELRFNEPVSVGSGDVRVLDVNGDRVDRRDAVAADALVTVSVPESLPEGSYVVAWRVASADAHPVSGAYTFSIGTPSVGTNGVTPEELVERSVDRDRGVQVAVDVANMLQYASVLTLLGLVVFVLVSRPDPTGRTPDYLRRIVVGAAGLGAVGFVSIVATEAALFDGRFAAMTDSSALGAQITSSIGLQAGLGLAGVALMVAALRLGTSSVALRAAFGIAGSTAAVSALVVVGHTRTALTPWLAGAGDALHLGAAGVWVGGLIGLAAYLAMHHRAEDIDPHDRALVQAEVITRFSRVASVAIVAVVISGVVMGWTILGSLEALATTSYGRTLLVKVGLFGVVAALGGYNHFALVSQLELFTPDARVSRTQRLRTTIRAELAIIAAVVVVTGLLTSQSPTELNNPDSASNASGVPGHDHVGTDAPGAATTGPPTTLPSITLTEPFGDGTATVTVSPGIVGTNQVIIGLADPVGAPFTPDKDPVVQFRLRSNNIGPLTATAEPLTAGQYQLNQDFALAGLWEINVSAVASDFSQPQAIMRFRISP